MAHASSLKIFETLRSAFDEKQATKIAEAVEAALVVILTVRARLLRVVTARNASRRERRML